MRRDEADVLLETLQERVARRDGWDRNAFELRDLRVDQEGEELVVKIIYRQRHDGEWWGYTVREIRPWYQDRPISPQEAAHDIYDFVLVEPDLPPSSEPDAAGVRWRSNTD